MLLAQVVQAIDHFLPHEMSFYSRLMEYGIAGLLMGVILAYSSWVLTKVVPQKDRDHLKDVKELHKECEQSMERITVKFADVTNKQSDAHAKSLDRFGASIDRLNESLTSLAKEIKK
jgi:peptidoglycan hydrolase CwlO-like protein